MTPETEPVQVSYVVICVSRFQDAELDRAFKDELHEISEGLMLFESYSRALEVFRQVDDLVERYLQQYIGMYGLIMLFEVTPRVDFDYAMAVHLMTTDNGVGIMRIRYFWPLDATLGADTVNVQEVARYGES